MPKALRALRLVFAFISVLLRVEVKSQIINMPVPPADPGEKVFLSLRMMDVRIFI